MIRKSARVIFVILLIGVFSSAIFAIYFFKQNIKEGRILENNGLDYYEKGYFREAAKEFEKARQRRYSNTRLLGLQANSYLFIKNYKKAEETYKKVLQIDKNDIWAMNQLAILYIVTDQKTKALEILHKAVEKDPEAASSLLLMATTYTKMNNLLEARKYYDLAEGQQNNELLAKLIRIGKQQLISRGRNEEVVEDVFPVIQTNVFSSRFKLRKENPKLAIISLNAQPVYYKLHEEAQVKIFGVPVNMPKGVRTIYMGIVESYDNLEDYPVMPLDLKKVEIYIDSTRLNMEATWPSPLAKVKDVDTVQFDLKTARVEVEDIKREFKVFKFEKLKGLKRLKGNIIYDNKKSIITFKSVDMFAPGTYLVYISPKLKSKISNSRRRAKIWSFSVVR